MYIIVIIADAANTVNSRRAKRKPPKGGYHAQMKQSEENSLFMLIIDIQHFIRFSPLIQYSLLALERKRSIDYHTRFRQLCQAFLSSFA